MVKWISIILIFISSSSVGLYKSYEIKERKQLLTEFQELMERLMTEICYFKRPLPVIFSQMINNDKKTSDYFLRQCYGLYMYSEERKSLKEIWDTAINETYRYKPLKEDDLRVFYHLGSIIGQSSFDAQKGHFELIRKELSNQIADAEHENKTTGSLYRKAGISIGAVLAIAFI